MGQICSRRNPDHKKTDEFIKADADAISDQQLSDYDQFEKFLKESGISISPIQKLTLEKIFASDSVEEKINLFFSDLEVFGDKIKSLVSSSCELSKIRLPIAGFDFVNHANFIPSSLSSSVFRPIVHSRSDLVRWYLTHAVRVFEKKIFLAVVVRLMLGKRPKAELDDLETDSLSDPVALLLLIYHLLEFANAGDDDPLAGLLSCSGSEFVANHSQEVPKLRNILKSANPSVLSLLPPEQEFPQRLLRDLLADPSLDDILIANSMKTLRIPAYSRKDKQRLNTLFLNACKMIETSVISNAKKISVFALHVVYDPYIAISPEILLAVEKVYQVLPSEMEGDSGMMEGADRLERHIEAAKLLLEVFRFISRISFQELKSRPEWASERRELKFIEIVRSGLKQWTDQSVFTLKAVDAWWGGLVANIELTGTVVGIEPRTAHKILFQELLLFAQKDFMIEKAILVNAMREVASLLDPETLVSIARNIAFCSDVQEPLTFIQTVFPPALVEHEVKLFNIRQLVCSLLLSTATGPETNRGIVGMIQASISDKEKRKRAELVARMMFCDQRILNLPSLESLLADRKTKLFECIFAFNPHAFLETSKIKDLCKILTVSDHDNAFVLHLACIAYIMVHEREGALSLIERLITQYRYEETWRLVVFFKESFGQCPPHMIVTAVSVCPSERLEEFIKSISPRSELIVTASRPVGPLEYLTRFPDLSKQSQVEEYIEIIGEDNGAIGVHEAEALAFMDSICAGNNDRFSSLATLASIGCF